MRTKILITGFSSIRFHSYSDIENFTGNVKEEVKFKCINEGKKEEGRKKDMSYMQLPLGRRELEKQPGSIIFISLIFKDKGLKILLCDRYYMAKMMELIGKEKVGSEKTSDALEEHVTV